ncbi:hypothetical protein L1987_85046 [Smallanthus sonchifolius]|uniref:Uncharacterized protein n=1 Tax=Smallanthus sonchifolius TaxID=185202 RepID=A0ACB8XWH6_9ASTR|nr:hypothetical protein L1987_85046 [Smallanthus sonchifolius]
MSSSRKRGTAKCKSRYTNAASVNIQFNEDGIAIGPNRADFMSSVGLEFRNNIPYHLPAKDVEKKLYDDVWTKIKKYWDSFAAKALTEEYEEKSRKAKISAHKNVEPARVGRRGMNGFMDVWEDRWGQLLSKYDLLSDIQDERSKIYTTGRAQLNLVTNLYQLGPHQSSESVLTGRLKELANGSYYEVGKYVVTEVVGNGWEHGGRSRLVSSVIGISTQKRKKTKEVEILQEEINALQQHHDQDATEPGPSTGRRGNTCASDRSYNDLPLIETMTLGECEKVCKSNCSCTAYTNSNTSGTGSGCLLWFGDLIDIRTFAETGDTLYIRMPPSELGKSKQ